MAGKGKATFRLVFLPPTGDWPFGAIEVDDERVYALAADLKRQTSGFGPAGVVWEFSGFDVVNRCSSCGRSDTVPRKVEGPTIGAVIAQAVERRLLIPAAEVRAAVEMLRREDPRA